MVAITGAAAAAAASANDKPRPRALPAEALRPRVLTGVYPFRSHRTVADLWAMA